MLTNWLGLNAQRAGLSNRKAIMPSAVSCRLFSLDINVGDVTVVLIAYIIL